MKNRRSTDRIAVLLVLIADLAGFTNDSLEEDG
jgi:hypothetical protein